MKNFEWSLQLTANKRLEVNALNNLRPQWAWFNICFSWTRKYDHAGLSLEVEILGRSLSVEVRDVRHWNHEEDRFYYPNEVETNKYV